MSTRQEDDLVTQVRQMMTPRLRARLRVELRLCRDQTLREPLTDDERAELSEWVTGSHDHFIEGLLAKDAELTRLAYKTYVRALATLLDAQEE